MTQPISRRTAIKAGAAVAVTAGLPFEAAAQEPKRQIWEGYTDQLSYAPGDEVKLHLSSSTAKLRFTVIPVRGRAAFPPYPAEGEINAAAQHPIPKDASARGCGWPVATKFKLPDNTPSGYYEIICRRPDENASLTAAFFIVRPKEAGKNAKILIQLATNTYNAYTNWGGYSLYAYHGKHKVQGRRVSFDRPISSQFTRWELPFIQWAEKAGYAIDFAVNSDLEFRPELLKPYKLVLSVGHDEYWSAPMRDNLEKYIADGGNCAFFSGNTCCWQVRSEENGRALACWKQNFGDDPVYKTGDYKTLTSLWSHYLVNRPENSLTGVGFLWGGYHRSHGQFMDGSGAYTAHRPDHWLFAGTNLKKGDSFGAKLPDYKVVGYECDGCELAWKDGLPFPTCTDGTPKNFEVLATSPASSWACRTTASGTRSGRRAAPATR